MLLDALAADPRLDDALAATGLDAATGRALVAVLESEHRLVRLADGLAVPQAAYDEARRIVIEGCRANGRFTLAELRDATGTSRRYAQALLERMDADGTTRRIDDYRVLAPAGGRRPVTSGRGPCAARPRRRCARMMIRAKISTNIACVTFSSPRSVFSAAPATAGTRSERSEARPRERSIRFTPETIAQEPPRGARH